MGSVTQSAIIEGAGTRVNAGTLWACALGVVRRGISAEIVRRIRVRHSRPHQPLQPRQRSPPKARSQWQHPVSSSGKHLAPRRGRPRPALTRCEDVLSSQPMTSSWGKTFPASLIELPHREFDVILGMDWLTANRAVVDCGAHVVRLRAEDGSDVLIRGELLPKAPEFISYIHARRLIRKKCEAFLCTVRDTRQEAPSRGNIPTPTLQQQIASAQSSDDFCIQTVELVSRGEKPDFAVRDGPYPVTEQVEPVVYRLELPSELSKIHDVFHVSMLRRYRSDPSHVIPADTVTLDENLTYEEEPVEILAREVCQLRNKTIPLVKVLWRSHTVEEATWETEESMRTRYPHLFSDQ
ncbi:unnamed protein product [Cuscuta campestris]|uniref:Tf2-1-like SH3-like domain-containing protein n=1 Tax=Cuscuta campestris TaxID=132261 RepID=A0A484NK10_9ASTE|nr:unnamed protein product [Cuscuta campestris]